MYQAVYYRVRRFYYLGDGNCITKLLSHIYQPVYVMLTRVGNDGFQRMGYRTDSTFSRSE